MKFILTATLLLLSLPAAAAEKPLKIAENHTDFSARFIDSIARTSMALGVKEPLIIRSETGAAVVGGSLGAQVFNEEVPKALALLAPELRPQVIHQAGEKHIATLKANYTAAGVMAECAAFIADMAQAYAEADLVLCRAGALTVAELACVGVASVLVPFPYAVDDHQTGNARYLADADAGILVGQKDFSAEKLAELLGEITRGRCLEMAQKARVLAKPQATQGVVQAVEELVEP